MNATITGACQVDGNVMIMGTTTGRLWFTGFHFHGLVHVWVQGEGWKFSDETFGEREAVASWLTDKLLQAGAEPKGTA